VDDDACVLQIGKASLPTFFFRFAPNEFAFGNEMLWRLSKTVDAICRFWERSGAVSYNTRKKAPTIGIGGGKREKGEMLCWRSLKTDGSLFFHKKQSPGNCVVTGKGALPPAEKMWLADI